MSSTITATAWESIGAPRPAFTSCGYVTAEQARDNLSFVYMASKYSQRAFAREIAALCERPVSQPTLNAWLSGKTAVPAQLRWWSYIYTLSFQAKVDLDRVTLEERRLLSELETVRQRKARLRRAVYGDRVVAH